MKKLTLISLITACSLYAGGYKIPENSVNAVALSAANIAHSHGADSAYYNPANMVFMDDENSIDVNLMYIGLDPIKFEGSGSMNGVSINAQRESFAVPSLHFVSKKLGNARVGLSIVTPGGLSKRWNKSPAVDTAKEFTLFSVEVNPTVAIALSHKVAIAFGFRAIYSSGIVKSNSAVSRDMSGDSVDMGYNLALSYKPTKTLDIGLTYRSKVDMSEEGNAKLYNPTNLVYDGGSTVTIPLPATLSIAVAYNFVTNTTVELVYEKNMWSAYKSLDFNYAGNVGNLKPYFDDAIAKNWNDTNAYRIGITQNMQNLTLMVGAVYDETPIPSSTMSFELPDSNSISVSLGAKYQINDKMDIGLSGLYSMRDTRSVTNSNLSGKFSNSDVLIIATGLEYKF